ncbi:MAG: hypothetical protein R3E97_20475 [Candidatus Eisenbacteria bacterium]
MQIRRLPLFLGLGLLAACGQQFDLPPQPPPQVPVVIDTYNLSKIWSVTSPSAMASQGSLIYVIKENQSVGAYFVNDQVADQADIVHDFQGLIRPVQIAVAQRESIYVYVADEGDMTVKRYHYTGGSPRSSFTDSRWNEFSGLTADAFLNVYVSDASRDTVFKYTPTGQPDMLISDEGSGRGFVNEPNGLYWNGEYVLCADTGKNWVQRLNDSVTNTAAPGPAIGEDFELDRPEGVSTDRGDTEHVYVADTGSGRVFKFTSEGTFVDSVYTPSKIPLASPVEDPKYLAVAGVFVFLADPPNDRILALELAGVPDSSAVGQP